MSNGHDDKTLSAGTSRRRFLQMLGATAVGSSGLILFPDRKSLAQPNSDNPVDCSPIGVGGKAPAPFKPDSALPVRVRKSAFELSSAEVERLRDAYCALRKLSTDKPNDPRGWLRQGFVHCWYCGGGSDQKEGQEIHGGWFFFPWHRAFLYFHERILAKLIGDDTFALPYWDWDSQDRQTFPSIYGIPKDPSDCLFDVFRSAMSGSNIPNVVAGPTIMNKTMNAPNNKLFMGWQSGNTGQSGAMENQPHGPVHIWTGDTTLQAANTDMGVLATAAQDPVFFAHHANIDRLWDVWLGLSSQHENYTSPTWLTNTWQFYDENGVWTEIAVSDVVDHTKSLRYEYQPPSKKPIWARRQLVSGATALAFHPAPELLMANAPSGIELGETPLTRSVALPAQTAKTFAALTASSPPAYSLHIEGIQVSSDHQALFEVYLNSPNANAKTGVDVPNFVGTVTVLAMRHNGVSHDHGSVNVAFDITETLARTVKNTSELSVTLVPFAADGNPPKNHAVSFKRIYIQSLQ